MTLTRRRLLAAAACTPLAALIACSPRTPAMTPEEAQFVHKLTARMRTHCIGRHLIDLPEAFVLNPVDRVEIEGVEVSVRPMTKTVFETRLQRRTEELQKQVIDVIDNEPVLMDVRDVPVGIGKVFNRAESYAYSRIWELMAWQDGFEIQASVKAVDYSLDEPLANDPSNNYTNVEEKFTHLLTLYSRVRGRAQEEIPREPGDCFAHGFYRGAQAEAGQFYVNYHLKDAPDVFVQLSSISGDGSNVARPESGLLQRRSQIERDTRRSGIEILRLVPRNIGHDGYEEFVAREPAKVTSARVNGHTAVVQTDQNAQGVARPFLTIELFNGHYIPSPPRSLEEQAMIPDLTRATLSEGQVLALWDAITATIRPRPGAL
ncbi:T6SS immunity protein Tli4 family protein [Caldimonas sp.]|uniref:T6SS immunity protein Tli4 family protein n=1 Tax=Caldimonas sp. TaxID=2838790 RepID=UPI00391D43BD